MKMRNITRSPIVLTILFTAIFAAFACSSGDESAKKVKQGDFYQTFTETGELASVKTRSFVMPLFGRYWYQLKIVGLLEHGSVVQAGDSILQFDPSEIKKYIVGTETEFENQKVSLEKLKVELDNRKSDLLSDLKNQQASFNLKKLELEQFRFESEKTRKIKQLEFKQAEILLEKSKKRIDLNNTIAENELMIQKSWVSRQEKELKNAHKVLAQLTIRTPISGIFQVGSKFWSGEKIRIGESVYFGTCLGSVPDLTWMKVNSTINETDIFKVKPGLKVNVRLDALPSVVFKGEVSSISKLCHPFENSKRKVFDVEIKMLESDQRLKPGMTVSCEYICNKFDNALYVSNDCLLTEGKRHYVFLKKGSRDSKVEVAVRAQNNNHSMVEGNIEKGQQLVVVDNIQSKKE
jgi:HlyD family secretion protein